MIAGPRVSRQKRLVSPSAKIGVALLVLSASCAPKHLSLPRLPTASAKGFDDDCSALRNRITTAFGRSGVSKAPARALHDALEDGRRFESECDAGDSAAVSNEIALIRNRLVACSERWRSSGRESFAAGDFKWALIDFDIAATIDPSDHESARLRDWLRFRPQLSLFIHQVSTGIDDVPSHRLRMGPFFERFRNDPHASHDSRCDSHLLETTAGTRH